MKNKFNYNAILFIIPVLLQWACSVDRRTLQTEDKTVPESYKFSFNSTNNATLNWREYFSDVNLISLIDTALKNNRELKITLQEIEISKNEVRSRKGEYLPFVGLGGSAGLEKAGHYTRNGAVDEQLEIKPGTEFPEPLQDYMVGAFATWEIDVWKKLRNAKKSAVSRYLASIEGKNFMVTNLIAEIADAYYELMSLDNLLEIIEKNIQIQSNALQVIKQQKDAAKVSQLAVNRFEAQLLNTTNLKFEIIQNIVQSENRINFLCGRYNQPVQRSSELFNDLKIDSIKAGIPSQLLINRPDIRQAEFELTASRLDVKVARARFYPSVGIKAGIGYQAFNPTFLIQPESILYNLTGDLMAPLINRNAIRAAYNTANAQQLQAVFNYEQKILEAYMDVLNQLSKLENFSNSYSMKDREVKILMEAVDIANSLFYSARADYGEVLLTQREALESKMELLEIKMKQLNAKVNIYRALGGGWN